MNERASAVGSLIIAVGIALGGWFVGWGFVKGRSPERVVSVKGVAEREVKADIALWPLRFVATDNVLSVAQQKMRRSASAVFAFLQKHAIDSSATEVQKLEVNDLLANPYRTGTTLSRYIITQTIIVRLPNPDLVARASQSVGELIDAGVVLSSEGVPEGGPTYLVTTLNALKPAMIAEATASARKGAEQFAKDSGSELGPIRQANQGVFEILPRDRAPGIFEGSQIFKTIRVVSTVEYTLKD